ncbi:fluoride efflux transporter FluC [Streptomyces griseus]|uniref:Fluoride-specific ion channel FluC n=1 Tax=Streptomyces griseus subsp. griseus (strain JCM 4626 / CBS 651.72 / NBRC 13350 / KCC S-0626 / ISP 5235) TaxID=455632 RepID=B1VSX7_STRGG|nr:MULTISPECIES: CrcB family protein [Streptomyces]MYR11726.1 fluoride efflux transporter CrcB [Streptomyces sp. SID724]MYR48433.1 fluoride efflux transporter CrcB [Streptomyces sp. SID4928]EGE40350.1 CrcB-like protein [Streptomyces sp. ACT-1]MBW3703336.1 CrcB family protein [Streptomyces griseus]NEB56502.1 CrcB family protein [Streptomyces griseus]
MTDWLLVIAGALVGAPLRYLLGVDAKFRLHSVFPWGTFAANAGGALFLGFLAEAVTDGDLGARLNLLLATGFCGALSTWSTFSYELLTLTSARRLTLAAGYLLLTVGAGVGLSFAGAAVANAAF